MKKKQHYVPQFYLSYFACDGKVETYNTKYCVFKQKHPSKICYEDCLYETETTENNKAIGGYYLPNQIENIFADYENDFSNLLKKISHVCIRDNLRKALILTTDEKKLLIHLVVNFLVRNPESMERLKLNEVPKEERNTTVYSALDSFLREMQMGGAKPAFVSARMKAMLTNEFEGSLPEEIQEELETLDFCFLFDENGGFITSDFPVFYGDDIGFEDISCLYMPLTPFVAVMFGNYPKMRGMRNRLIDIEESVVNEFNKKYVSTKHYRRYLIARSRKYIECALKEQ